MTSSLVDWTSPVLFVHQLRAQPGLAALYARAIRRAWQLREVVQRCHRTVGDACDLGADPGEIIVRLTRALEGIDEASATDREALREGDLLRAIENPADQSSGVKVPVRLGELGYLLGGGLDGGTLTVVGARPSCGKTSLGLGLCVHASRAVNGCASLIVSVEMATGQVGMRLLTMRSGLAVQRVRAGDMGVDEFNPTRNKAAVEADQGFPVFVLDGVRDARAIAAYARRCVRRHGVRLIIIDYLGLCTMPGDYDRHDLRIGAMTGLFKSLALDTDTAVVLLAQLNRGPENRQGDQRPRMADLRDSGIIEQDADNVILIHREREPSGDACDTTLILDKQRQGQTGNAIVQYHRPTMQYRARHVEAAQ